LSSSQSCQHSETKATSLAGLKGSCEKTSNYKAADLVFKVRSTLSLKAGWQVRTQYFPSCCLTGKRNHLVHVYWARNKKLALTFQVRSLPLTSFEEVVGEGQEHCACTCMRGLFFPMLSIWYNYISTCRMENWILLATWTTKLPEQWQIFLSRLI